MPSKSWSRRGCGDVSGKQKKMKKILQIITIGLIMILSSCSSKNLMKYYYPINQESEIKIYKYINPEDKESTEYWKTTTNPIQKTILTESFDSKFNLYNTFEEKINEDKAELLKYIEYEGEQMIKEIIATVKKNQVYSSSKSEPYNYAVEYTNKYGKFTFEKKRQFVNFEEIEIQGKKYETAKFKDEYFINAIDQKEKFGFNQNTFYAEGVGMVKYERFITNDETKILELSKILTENEFKEIKKEASR
jgi:hypothetical protein